MTKLLGKTKQCILSIANGGFVSFVNSRGPGNKPLGKTTKLNLLSSKVLNYKET